MATKTEPGTRLSERELSILRLVAEGHSNAEIAQRLAISRRTVENHLQNVYAKTETRNRVQAINWLSGTSQ